MRQALADGLMFLRESWKYLGCDRGSGRWRARRRYFAGIWYKTPAFILECKRDREEMA